MDAPSRSLAHLQGCVRGLRDATVGGYSKGIKVAKIAVENATEDFKATVARTKEACRWKHGVAEEWYAKGEEVCGDLLRKAAEALGEAEAREAAEVKVRIMEDQCEELVNLAEQAEKQAGSETEPEQLIELEEEMEQRKDTVEGLGQSLKETIPAEFKERAQQAVQDSIKIVEEGKRHLGHESSTQVPERGLRGRELQRTHGGRSSGEPLAPNSRGARGKEQNGRGLHDGVRWPRNHSSRVGSAEGK
jgi:hypothetical protein